MNTVNFSTYFNSAKIGLVHFAKSSCIVTVAQTALYATRYIDSNICETTGLSPQRVKEIRRALNLLISVSTISLLFKNKNECFTDFIKEHSVWIAINLALLVNQVEPIKSELQKKITAFPAPYIKTDTLHEWKDSLIEKFIFPLTNLISLKKRHFIAMIYITILLLRLSLKK